MPKHVYISIALSTDICTASGIIVVHLLPWTQPRGNKIGSFLQNLRIGMNSLLQNKLLKRYFVTLLRPGSCPTGLADIGVNNNLNVCLHVMFKDYIFVFKLLHSENLKSLLLSIAINHRYNRIG